MTKYSYHIIFKYYIHIIFHIAMKCKIWEIQKGEFVNHIVLYHYIVKKKKNNTFFLCVVQMVSSKCLNKLKTKFKKFMDCVQTK